MSDPLPIGTRVGRVRIEARIGQGGMGDVFRGFDEVLQRPVALKRLRSGSREKPLARARFLREARLLSRLDHPNVCRIWDLIERSDGDYLVLELVDGRSLDRLLNEESLGESDRWRIAAQIAEALAAAHRRGIVHRDLKPENVMVTPAGDAKVLDFGIARPTTEADDHVGRDDPAEVESVDRPTVETDETLYLGRPELAGDSAAAVPDPQTRTTRTVAGTVVGSLRWMSPDQARGESLGPASDVFSLGLLLGRLLADVEPRAGVVDRSRLLRAAGRGEVDLSGIADHALGRLLRELLADDPDARPTADEAAGRIRSLGDRGRRRRRWMVAGSLVATLLILAVGTTRWMSRPRPLVGTGDALRLAVLPFVDATGGPADAWVEWGLARVLTDDLATRSGLSVVPVDDVRSSRERLGAEVDPDEGVLRALGATVLVRARVEDHPRGVRIRTELIGRDGRRDGVDAIGPTVIEATGILAVGLSNRLGVPEPVEDLSADPFAVQVLEMGIQRRAVGHPGVARHYFEVALDRDPSLDRARIELGEVIDDLGRPEEALELLLDVASSADDEIIEARALVAAFRIQIDRGRIDDAERLAVRALDLLERAGAEQERLQALNQLAVLAYRRGDLEIAESRWREVLDKAERIDALVVQADATRNSAYVELRRGRVDEAEELLLRSLDLFRSLGIPQGELSALGSLGLLANQKGDLDRAEERLLEAQGIAERIDAPRMAMTGFLNLGAVAFGRGDLARAAAYTEEALALAEELGDPRQQVHALGSLAYFATREGRLGRATEHLEEASGLADSADVTDARWILRKNLGYLRCRQGRFDEAASLVDEALAERREKFGLLVLARCRYHRGDLEGSLGAIFEARGAVGPTGGWTADDEALLDFVRVLVQASPGDLPPLPDEGTVSD